MKLVRQIHCVPGTTCSIIPLEKRKIIKKSLATGFLNLIILAIFMALVYSLIFKEFTNSLKEFPISEASSALKFFTSFQFFYLIIIPLVLIIFHLIWQIFYFRYYFYDLTTEEIVIMKGVISRTRIAIRYEKIQNIFVDQDFWDRIFHLYDVHIATADIQSVLASHIDGVSKESSKKLKAILTENIKKIKAGDGL